MRDPIGAFQAARENFILYVKTAFGTRFTGLELERERLPRYQGSGKTVRVLTEDDAPGLSPEALADFRNLASLRLAGGYQLHRHQVAMLRTVLSGQHCVVTAGTGSGKTESFLLPLFAY